MFHQKFIYAWRKDEKQNNSFHSDNEKYSINVLFSFPIKRSEFIKSLQIFENFKLCSKKKYPNFFDSQDSKRLMGIGDILNGWNKIKFRLDSFPHWAIKFGKVKSKKIPFFSWRKWFLVSKRMAFSFFYSHETWNCFFLLQRYKELECNILHYVLESFTALSHCSLQYFFIIQAAN